MSPLIKLIVEYNNLMAEAINGPNCLDTAICKGDCCTIRIDIPKALAEEYIQRGLATPDQFHRGHEFSFTLSLNVATDRCFFYSPTLNGCTIHLDRIKPPQCWIYPTGFLGEKSACTNAEGWVVHDLDKTRQAKKLLDEYTEFSRKEFKEQTDPEGIKNRLKPLSREIQAVAPKELVGIKDTWTHFIGLPAEGLSLSFKRFCSQIECDKEFLECPNICPKSAALFCEFVESTLFPFIEKHGAKETYSILELQKFQDLPLKK